MEAVRLYKKNLIKVENIPFDNSLKDDEVLVTPRSFIVSASCVVNVGLKPVFADVDDNGNLSIDSISNVFNNKIKPDHLFFLKNQEYKSIENSCNNSRYGYFIDLINNKI